VATSSKFRNNKIAENLYREALDFCLKNKKHLIRTKSTIDGKDKIFNKFTEIAKEKKYESILVINPEDEQIYKHLEEKVFKENGNQKNLINIFNLIEKIEDKSKYPNNDELNLMIKIEIKKNYNKKPKYNI
jgi:hypothetical protein